MNYKLFTPGIFLMVAAASILIFGPDLSIRGGIGVIFLAAIGLGLTVAGSPDPSKKNEPGVDRPYGIDQSGGTDWRRGDGTPL